MLNVELRATGDNNSTTTRTVDCDREQHDRPGFLARRACPRTALDGVRPGV
jgi:hypothetical protein